MPPPKGTYIFFSRLAKPGEICINKRGRMHYFDRGWYAYVGSAFNSGGLKSRLNRHFHGADKKHWNIDFFRQRVVPHHRAWVSRQNQKIEHHWAAVFQLMEGVTAPVVNFGNSDDRGRPMILGVKKTHLFHRQRKPDLDAFQKAINHHFPGYDRVVEIHLPIE